MYADILESFNASLSVLNIWQCEVMGVDLDVYGETESFEYIKLSDVNDI